MAEITEAQARQICSLLSPSFERMTGKPCHFHHMESPGRAADFYVESSGEILSVQHTRLEETEGWFKSGAQLAPVMSQLISKLQMGQLEVSAHFEFETIPVKHSEIESFCRAAYIALMSSTLQGKGGFRLQRDSLDAFNHIFKYVDDLHLNLSDSGLISWGYKAWEVKGVPIDEYSEQLFKKFVNKYDRLAAHSVEILIYEIEPSWIGDYYLTDLRRRFAALTPKFKQVWLITRCEEGIAEQLVSH